MDETNSPFRRSGKLAMCLIAPLLGFASSSSAQPPDPDKVQWSLGIAAISSPEPYVGADDDLLVVPVLSVSYKRFFFRGISAGYEVWKKDGFTVEAIARARLAGYDEDDSRFLDGMEDRSKSADLGVELDWQPSRRLGFHLTPVADVLGKSRGQEVGFDIYSPVQLGRIRLEPRVGLLWQSDDFVDYYYGVRPEEARPGRPAYRGKSTVNLGAGVLLFSPIGRHLAFQSFVRIEKLGDEIEESPIVDSSTAVTAFVALSYRF
jgi:MipA family protein